MPQVETNGITLQYERSGSGEPLLLIMGLGAQLTTWPIEFVGALESRGFDVVRYDNRDAGRSSEIPGKPPSMIRAFIRRVFRRPVGASYSLVDMADDAAGLLDALDLSSAHVVGVSMGGMIAQSLAIHHPDRVRSLTSIMSNPGDGSGGFTPGLAIAMARQDAPTRHNAVDLAVEGSRRISGPHFDEAKSRELAQVAVERSFRPEGTARQTAAIMASPNRVPALRQLRIPTLVIHGMVDPLVRPSGGLKTAEAVPHSRLLMFNDMGHDLPSSRLDEIVEAIALNTTRAGEVQNEGSTSR